MPAMSGAIKYFFMPMVAAKTIPVLLAFDYQRLIIMALAGLYGFVTKVVR